MLAECPWRDRQWAHRSDPPSRSTRGAAQRPSLRPHRETRLRRCVLRSGCAVSRRLRRRGRGLSGAGHDLPQWRGDRQWPAAFVKAARDPQQKSLLQRDCEDGRCIAVRPTSATMRQNWHLVAPATQHPRPSASRCQRASWRRGFCQGCRLRSSSRPSQTTSATGSMSPIGNGLRGIRPNRAVKHASRQVVDRRGRWPTGRDISGARVGWFSRKATSWNGTARRLGIAVDFQSTPIEPLALQARVV